MERRYNKERAASSGAASNEGIRMARQPGVVQDLVDSLVAANFASYVFLKVLKQCSVNANNFLQIRVLFLIFACKS